jgi:probable addiction module antidote protein
MKRTNGHTNGASQAADPATAASVLNGILERGNTAKLLVALRQLTEERGGIGRLAERASLNRTQLYKTLSNQGNPDIRRLTAILQAMGLRLAVQPLPRRARATRQSRSRPARASRA